MSELNDEMVERIGAFWEKYKFSILVAVLMAISAAAGLSYRTMTSDRAQEIAADAMFAAIHAADNGEWEIAERELARIDRTAFPQMRNLALTALALAGAEDAETKLSEAITHEPDAGLRALFMLRHAESLINNGKFDAAISLLTENEESAAEGMQLLFAEKIGDAHYAAGRPQDALIAYRRAAEHAATSPSHLPVINLKIGAVVSLPPESGGE